jgi:type IV secretory pathway protease TraF
MSPADGADPLHQHLIASWETAQSRGAIAVFRCDSGEQVRTAVRRFVATVRADRVAMTSNRIWETGVVVCASERVEAFGPALLEWDRDSVLVSALTENWGLLLDRGSDDRVTYEVLSWSSTAGP